MTTPTIGLELISNAPALEVSEATSLTLPRPAAEIAEAVSSVLARSEQELAEDMLIALEVRAREAASDEIPLSDFLEGVGRNPDGSRRA